MAKLTLTDIAAGYALISTFNANNALIEAALENTLSRDGTTPNTMSVALDMNSQLINNLAVPVGDQDASTKAYVDTLVASITAASGLFDVTAAHNFTNQIDFLHAGGIRIMNGTDEVNISHDGTDLNIDGTATADINITGITKVVIDNGAMWVEGAILALTEDAAEWVTLSTTTSAATLIAAGATAKVLQLTAGTDKFVRINSGALGLAEVSAALSDVGGDGQFWVKDDTPNIPKYTDDAGTDFDLVTGLQGSFTPTFTGYASPPSNSINYRIIGDWCFLTQNSGNLATTNATAITITDLPAVCRPVTQTQVSCFVTESAGTVAGNAFVHTDGTITFGVGSTTGGFTSGQSCGTPSQWTMSFPLNTGS